MEDLMNGMETTMDEIQYIVVKLGNEKYGIPQRRKLRIKGK